MSSIEKSRILIVDDEEGIREIFAEELSALGAQVQCVKSGDEALEILSRQAFDLMISDVRMPGGDGFTLVKSINMRIKPKPSIILCSGFNMHAPDDYQSLGIAAVLNKPFSWAEVVETVERVLSATVKTA